MIQAIAKVVKRLVLEFGERFRLTRVRVEQPGGGTKERDLTSYWKPPTEAAMEHLRRDDKPLTTEELMQMQV